MIRWKWGIAIAFLASTAVAAVTLFWLLTTSDGARFLLKTASSATSIEITAEKLEGRLIDRLHLTGLRIRSGDDIIRIGEAILSWHPLRLVKGHLEIENLFVDQLHIELKSPAKPDRESDSPEPPSSAFLPIPSWLRTGIEELRVKDFRMLRDGEEIFHFPLLATRVAGGAGEFFIPSLEWVSPYVHLSGQGQGRLKPFSLDLAAEVRLPAEMADPDLLGRFALPPSFPVRLSVAGSLSIYHGRVTAGDRDRLGVQLSSEVSGNLQGLRLERMAAYWLGGTVRGDLDMNWEGGFRLKGDILAEDLDPAHLADAAWSGRINADISGGLELLPGRPLTATVKTELGPSQWRGQTVSGNLAARWQDSSLAIDQFDLRGEGLIIAAKGKLDERIDFQAMVADLSLWLPDLKGEFQGSGWLKWQDQYLTGTALGEGKELIFREFHFSRLEFAARHPVPDGPLEFRVEAGQSGYKNGQVQNARLTARGNAAQHVITLEGRGEDGKSSFQAALAGSFETGTWRYKLTQLTARDPLWGGWTLGRPASFQFDEKGWSFSPLRLNGSSGTRITLEGAHQNRLAEGGVAMEWRGLPLAPLAKALPGTTLTGKNDGNILLDWRRDGLQSLIIHLTGSGELAKDKKSLDLRRFNVDWQWDQQGLEATAGADFGHGGHLAIQASSPEPIHGGEPAGGVLNLKIRNLDLAALNLLLPGDLPLRGKLNVTGEGTLSPERAIRWQGNGEISEATISWRTKGELREELRGHFDRADFRWDWQRDVLVANWNFHLQEDGNFTGRISLPLTTTWPVAILEEAPLTGILAGRLRERGLLTALFPDLIQESRGEITVDVALGGTPARPLTEGTVSLTGAGGYLPATGTQLDEVTFQLELEGPQAKITKLLIRSGPGEVRGNGSLSFATERGFNYSLNLQGEDFQVVNLPELQIVSNPRLSIRGDGEGIAIKGEVLLPEVKVTGTRKVPEVRPSPDAIVIRPAAEEKKAAALNLDLQVLVILGKKALVSAENFTGRLAGEVTVAARSFDKFTGQGQIRISEGTFTAYGAKLEVQRGNINFNNGPLGNPALDLLALREIGAIQAGVRVSGTGARPEINLYSRPGMADKDILAYILLGRPFRSDRQEADILAIGVGALLPQGPGFLRKFGFIDVDLGGLFGEQGAVRFRYRIRKNLELESTLGKESGVDLFHVIEFE